MPTQANAIEFHDASVTLSGTTIWSHGSFAIPSGSVTAIVGTNGTGKTTMLKTELGLVPLSSGTTRILGDKPGAQNRRIGYVPQNYASNSDSPLTSLQSVLLGMTGETFGWHRASRKQRLHATKALEFVGIADRANERLSDLSGGQRQRVAIAQALASDPDLLLLDEPLANLDPASQREVVDVLARLNRELGMTIHLVAHDLNMLLPILTGAVYLLDGHPHYAPIGTVLDPALLTHLYGTSIAVVRTPQGDMFITPRHDGSTRQRTELPAKTTAGDARDGGMSTARNGKGLA
ncbi:ATP-binding cassette domain-containing protein [uncultured Bifidobacterium sp.]|uniref:metal ABC transporter ATP-binding protein n=1 Tax=uncultured Bifidobacterium sp. TaxID=165187 RepID=UPI00261339BC|nr:ATP-binding cassette domain-containing protein [uncultured Bifidobacterium sp.]